MKLVSLIIGVLCLVHFTASAANAANIQLTNIDYSLVSANFDENRFAASNVLIAIDNFTDSFLSLRIINDICPKIPGKFSCMAMAFPMFTGNFALGEVTTDSCGVRTQTSDVLLQNGEVAQIEIKNFRQMTCEVYYLADTQITLKLKSEEQQSTSTILINKHKLTTMPVIQPPTILYNPIADQKFSSVGSAELKGAFFDDKVDVNAFLNVNRMDKKIELNLTHNPCAGKTCEAIRGDLIRRTLVLDSVKSDQCNEKTYYSSIVSVYDAYPAVVGAVRTYANVEIHDTRFSVCDRANGSVTAVVTVTKRQKFTQDQVISESTATFQLSKAEVEQ